MATPQLQSLAAVIYHEEQPPDSMLCAQHALNNLLQGAYFTPMDLAQIATKFDQLEDSVRDEAATQSHNMDDSGFFSVQVIQDALSVWGLTLSPWRSEEMRPYQDEPHKMLAFIFNYQQHWYTLRRFGNGQTHPEIDNGEGHWFNLNSQLASPSWIGKLHLGMVIAQAEQDGYSVFAVTQEDPASPIAIPRVEADRAAARITESGHADGQPVDEEDEDMDMQRALQASLAAEEYEVNQGHPPPTRHAMGDGDDDEELDEEFVDALESSSIPLDPLEASRARSARMLEHTLRHQHFAQQEIMQETRSRPPPPPQEDEEEMMRQAIEASMASAKAEGHPDADGDQDMDEPTTAVAGSAAAATANPYPPTAAGVPDRVYDDDDAELQAAIAASMGHLPEDWVSPNLEPVRRPAYPPSSSSTHPRESHEEEDSHDADTSMNEEVAEEPAQEVDLEEMRRKRLARYG